MKRLSSLYKNIHASLTPELKLKYALSDLLTLKKSSLAGMKRTMAPILNKALIQEFDKAELGEEALKIDFFTLIANAVNSRVKQNDPDWDELFQEVAMQLMTRDGEKKAWISAALKMKESGKLTNLRGFLFVSFQNFVKDIHRKLSLQNKRYLQMSDPNDDEENGGFDLSREDVGFYEDQESGVSAKELYREILNNLSWPKSKEILKILVDNGIVGFIHGKGVVEVAQNLGVTPATVSAIYQPKFKNDLAQALRKLDDEDIAQRAKKMFASVQSHPLANLCYNLNSLI